MSLESPVYKFTSFTPLFCICLYSRLCRNLLADVTPAPFFLQDSAGPRQIVTFPTQRGPAEEAASNRCQGIKPSLSIAPVWGCSLLSNARLSGKNLLSNSPGLPALRGVVETNDWCITASVIP